MGDGKALQMGTSHNMGENFAEAFNIRYTGADGQSHSCSTTSFGLSTRIVGGLIMTHGDARGLRLPPVIAPIQVVLIALTAEVLPTAEMICADLVGLGVRAAVDARIDLSFGRRTVDWELKGVPCRLEIGKRELADRSAALVRRDLPGKRSLAVEGIVASMPQLLQEIQQSLFAQAEERQHSMTRDVKRIDEVDGPGFSRLSWSAVGIQGELDLAQRGRTVRCLVRDDGEVPDLEYPEERLVAYVAKAY